MFIRPWLEALKSRWMPGKRRNTQRISHDPVQTRVEALEEKVVLSAFDLVTVIPNQGVFLNSGDTMNEAPRELTLRFSPGQTINANSLGAVTVVRAGLDGIFDDPATPALESSDDVGVALGYIGIGDNPNEVLLRFASTLPDDQYRVFVQSTATPLNSNHLTTTTNDTLNTDLNKPYKSFTLNLDLGSQVEAVVPQPVIRSQVFTVANASSLANGDTLTVNFGPYSAVLEFNNNPANVPLGHIYVNRVGTNTAVATNIVNAIEALKYDSINNPLGYSPNVAVTASNGATETVTITGSSFEPTVTFKTVNTTALANTVVTVLSGANLRDADTLTVSLGATTVIFEFNNTEVNNSISPGRTRINFAGSTATPLSIATAINNAIAALGANSTIKSTLIGNSVAITGTTGTPAASWNTSYAVANVTAQNSGVFSQDFGTLSQATDKVVVYFNQDQLDRTIAEYPAYYRLFYSPQTVLNVADAHSLADGDTITVSLGGTVLTLEFNNLINTDASNVSQPVAAGHIRIDFNPATVTQSALATAITNAINTAVGNTTIQAAASGGAVTITAVTTGTPTASWNSSFAGTFSLIKTVLLPQTVNYFYNAQTGISAAVLTFAAPLPTSTYTLHVGATSEPNNTLDVPGTPGNSIKVGTIFSTQDYVASEYIGDGSGTSNNPNDQDVYQFKTNGINIVTVKLDSSATLNGTIALLDANGTQLTSAATGLGGSTTFAWALPAAGTYYVRVTSTGGTTTGGYTLTLHTDGLAVADDNNSSFLTATNLGDLGQGGLGVSGLIESQGAYVVMPQLPGGSDEPGHRDLPTGPFTGLSGPELGHGTGTDANAAPPGDLAQFTYSFPVSYGALQNEITEQQKDIIRQIYQIYSYISGIQFREVPDNQGAQQVVVGDLRVVVPTLPPPGPAGISGNPILLNSIVFSNDNTYGGGFTGTAFHEIGHNMGLGHSYDVPSIQGAGLSGEAVFTGDNDLIHLLRAKPNNGSDIDMYQFNITQTGTLSVQTVAERLGVPNLLNSVLTLYRLDGTTRTVVAQNDDFFSKDSGLEVPVTAGTYYIGVTSTGNDNYDPAISNSGFGGRSQGAYNLKLDFKPTSVSVNGLRDLTGQLLDGDHDGKAGGEFTFSFQATDAAHTIIVDKLATGSPSGLTYTGSLATPYKTIADALAASHSTPGAITVAPGSIVRIVGNGGADRDTSTVADNVPYAIGTDYNVQQTPLADGGTFQVPQGATVMIDAGALIKLHGQTVDVGTSSAGIDRQHGALQVLGTPVNNVYFTSWRDDAKGSIDDGTNGVATGEDWGGIVFRKDSDSILNGVFLNTVNHATLQYGGGSVSVDGGGLQTYNVIDLETSRPTISHNTIMNNADAAISANPDSFKADDGRIGPDIYGNLVTQNSTNGLFIRIQTALGGQFEFLNVTARFDDTDITHVLTQNLIINGDTADSLSSTHAARLMIDPGTIIKLSGARIETGVGSSNLIAEGTSQNPIRFTSQQDDRYGAGGTFDIKNDGNTTPSAGNWSGIFIGQTSTGSLDYVSITYAGGLSEVAGNTDYFNPVETLQGRLRVTNSLFQNNAGGQANSGGATARGGRGDNDSSTIFVRGEQPVLVNNTFIDNVGNVISINANSMQSVVMPDYGRSTGLAQRFTAYDDNYGPLVRLNKFANTTSFPQGSNTLGMNIRAEELTIESIWDDTDIAHVVRGNIISSEFHTYGGLTLQSSPTGSLVVKLQGGQAGFTATGDPLEITDRIGGTVAVIGQPNFPVILTSLRDDSVSAGYRPDGLPQFDTNGDNNNPAGPKNNPNLPTSTPSSGQPGDWNSLLFDQFSNDTNVAYVVETEPGLTHGNDINSTVANPQPLGNLAPNLNSGDENRRLGFEVHGFISPDSPDDIDVYSFSANAGTEVWIDTDFTSQKLDVMVELLNSAGTVIARSLNSVAEGTDSASINTWLTTYASDVVNPYVSPSTPTSRLAGTYGNSDVNPLVKDRTLGTDFYTSNFHDAGFRVVLPGNAGAPITYFVRVRSQPVANPTAIPKPTDADYATNSKTLTSGAYQLQVRLKQVDDIPGSTVRYADIRYATNGIETHGLPAHSPIFGEAAEQSNQNSNPDSSQYLGPLLQNDRNTISVSGTLDTSNSDVDFFQFTVGYSQIQVAIPGPKFFPTVFDIDWADGLTRPDVSIAVFNSARDLIYIGRASDIADDQSAPGQGQDLDDLSRSSLGALDAYIGSVNLLAGTSGAQTTYYVAVFSNGSLPTALTANFNAVPGGAVERVRLEPINSIRRIVEDHIGFTGYNSQKSAVAPVNGPLLPVAGTTPIALSANVRAFTLADVNLWVTSPSNLNMIDPFNGTQETSYNAYGVQTIQDLDMRSDGTLWGVRYTGNNTRNGELVQIDPATGAILASFGDGIADTDGDGTTASYQANIAATDAVAWHQNSGTTNTNYDSVYYAVQDLDDYATTDPVTNTDSNVSNISKLYRGRPDGGSAAWAADTWGAIGDIQDANKVVNTLTTGMQFVNGAAWGGLSGTLFGVSSAGQLYRINNAAPVGNIGPANNGNPDGNNNPNTAAASGNQQNLVYGTILNYQGMLNGGEQFVGLAEGPKNVENGKFANRLFILTSAGRIFCVDPSAANAAASMVVAFDTGTDNIADSAILATGLTGATGLGFSPADYNLWHPTERRGGEDGHGVNTTDNQTIDNSRVPTDEAVTGQYGSESLSGANSNQSKGGASFYFGLEEWGGGATNNYFQYGSTGQYGVVDGESQVNLTSNAAIGNNYNTPGGAYGSLVTNSFSLEGYTATDKPTLYFNYWLETQTPGQGKSANSTSDAARVYVSADDGLTWALAATNNSTLSAPGTADAELPAYQSTDANASGNANQGVQELYDTSSWRQARVDLRDYVGATHIKLRFDFSTSGRMGTVIDPVTGLRVASDDVSNPEYVGDTGDSNGFTNGSVGNSQAKGLNNSGEGFYIDDIIVGFASRGEMVTASNSVGAGFTDLTASARTKDPDPKATQQLLFGDYQLEIRRGQNYATLVDPPTPKGLNIVNPTLDVNDRQTNGQTVRVGNTVQDGTTVTVYDGLITKVFEFDLNNGGVTGTNTPVAITGTMGGDAQNLANAINTAFAGRNTVIAKPVSPSTNSDRVDIFNAVTVSAVVVPTGPILGTQTENNDTIGTATVSGITAAFTGTLSGSGTIGNGANTTRDVDFYSFTLNANQTIAFDIDVATSGDSMLRVFNAAGTQLVSSDDDAGPPPEVGGLESFLTFTAPSAGTYYLGVSGYNNSAYNPLTGAGTVAGSTFDYTLTATQVVGRESESGGFGFANDYPISTPIQIANVIPTFSAGTNGHYIVGGPNTGTGQQIGNSQQGITDADFYRVNLIGGQSLTVNLIDRGTIVDVDGFGANYLLGLVKDGSTVPLAFVIDGALSYTVPIGGDGIYYVAVIGDDGNPLTSPLNANFAGQGDSVGAAGNDTFYYALDITLTPPNFVPLVDLAVDVYQRQGDDNTVRTQGQFIIENNTILNSSRDGILIDDEVRLNGLPHPGAPLNTKPQNTSRLLTGMYIQNNIIARSGLNGIEINGDATATGNAGLSAVPFVKVVNNTIVGATPPSASGTGIRVSQNASPTLMNNILANLATGISIDNTSLTTEVEANLFQGNLSDGTTRGNNALFGVDTAGIQLFVDPASDNYYPAPSLPGLNNPIVDSSRNNFNDRAGYVAVTSQLSIPQSPILAPKFDRFGQLRKDDLNSPGPSNQPGLGANPFQDRGAIERADFTGGVVIPSAPQDNDGAGMDYDPTTNTIWIDSANAIQPFAIQTQFKLQLIDVGIGIDDNTVSGSDFVLLKNGVPLVENQDYFFTYNRNTNEAIFTSVSTFALDSRYQIALNAAGITDYAGNPLQNNQSTPITPANPLLANTPFSTSLLYFTYILTDGVNNPPVTAGPSAFTINEGQTLTFNGANQITISDPDAFLAVDGDPNMGPDGGRIQVEIWLPDDPASVNPLEPVALGTLTFDPAATGVTSNLVLNGGSFGLKDPSKPLTAGTVLNPYVIVGRVLDINEVLHGRTNPNALKFTPKVDFPPNVATDVVLTVRTNDLGKFGPPAPGTTIEATATRLITITVNPVNDEPTLNAIGPQTMLEDGTKNVPLANITPGGGETQTLTVTATSSDTTLFPPGSIVVNYTSPNTIGSIDFTPAANRFGSATITVTVKDSGGVLNGGDDTKVVTFQMTVTPVNDAPSFGVIGPQVLNEDNSLSVSIPSISAGPFESDTLTFSVTGNSNTTLFPPGSITVVNGNLVINPALNQNGVANITLTVDDGQASNNTYSETFQITVNAINDAPTLNAISPVSILEDAGPQAVGLSGISPGGGADENGQTLTLTVISNSNPTLTGVVGFTYNNVSIASGTGFSFVPGLLTGALNFTPAADQFGVANLVIQISDGNTVIQRQLVITVAAVNDKPTINTIANQIVDEDALLQTVPLTGITAGGGESQTMSITAVSDNTTLIPTPTITYTSPNNTATLTYKPTANLSGTANITVTVRDAGLNGILGDGDDGFSVPQVFTITVNPVNDEPTLNPINNPAPITEDDGLQTINLSGITAGPAGGPLENQILRVIATSNNSLLIANPITINYTSPNTTGTLSYTPVPNANGVATISVQVQDAGLNGILGDFDDGFSIVRTFDVVVNSVNDIPTIAPIADLTIPEDSPLQTINLTGILAGGGVDESNQALSITAVSSNTALIPNPTVVYTSHNSTGQLTFTPVAQANVDNAGGAATITVQVRDAGLDGILGNDDDGFSVLETFDVIVTPVADTPTNITLSNTSVYENRPAATVVGNLLTADADLPADGFTYSIVGGTGVGLFQINGAQLLTAQPFDFETTNSYTLTIRTTDQSSLTFDKTFTIQILNLNDAPTLNAIPPQEFDEDSGAHVINLSGITSGFGENNPPLTVTATSSVPGLFSLVQVNYNSPSTTGTLTLTPALNQNGTATITVTVTDNGGTANGGVRTFVQTFTVTVNAVNDAPTNINLSNSTIQEIPAGTMLPANVPVGQLTSVDPDTGDTFQYQLVTGAGSADNDKFQIVNDQLFALGPIDFDTQPTYSIRVRTTDTNGSGLPFEKVFTIQSTNVNEPATAISTAPNAGVPNSIPENQAPGSVVGTLLAADPDAGDVTTFTLVSGVGSTDNNRFSITTVAGKPTLIANQTFDYETRSSYSVRIRAVDALGLAFESQVTISITNVNEGPTNINLSNSTVVENTPIGTPVANITTDDIDVGDTFTYTLVGAPGTNDNAKFAINGNQLVVAVPPNYEENSGHFYTVRVRSTDAGGMFTEKTFTITITDVNETPSALSLSATSVNENQPVGTVVGTLSTTDQDVPESFTYGLVSGVGSTDNNAFTIVGNELRTAVVFDFEAIPTKTSYSVRIRTTDSSGHSIEQVFTIAINDTFDAPVISLADSPLTTSGHKIVVIDPAATITDIDSPNFDGGRLVVKIQEGEQTGDVLSIKKDTSSGLLLKAVRGKSILRLGKGASARDIATISGGTKGDPLVIQFGGGISKELFQLVMRNVTFRGKPFAAPRVISMQAFDETRPNGLGSNIETRNINVM